VILWGTFQTPKKEAIEVFFLVFFVFGSFSSRHKFIMRLDKKI
jgi:hypothetical protein